MINFGDFDCGFTSNILTSNLLWIFQLLTYLNILTFDRLLLSEAMKPLQTQKWEANVVAIIHLLIGSSSPQVMIEQSPTTHQDYYGELESQD